MWEGEGVFRRGVGTTVAREITQRKREKIGPSAFLKRGRMPTFSSINFWMIEAILGVSVRSLLLPFLLPLAPPAQPPIPPLGCRTSALTELHLRPCPVENGFAIGIKVGCESYSTSSPPASGPAPELSLLNVPDSPPNDAIPSFLGLPCYGLTWSTA